MKPEGELILIEDPIIFVEQLGGFHDVLIEKAEFRTDAQALTLTFYDINGNFTGLPEYAGFRPAALIFRGVKSIFMDVDLDDLVRVSNLQIDKALSGFRLGVELNIGIGSASEVRPSIISKFTELAVQELGH